jgi:hypothetical protein
MKTLITFLFAFSLFFGCASHPPVVVHETAPSVSLDETPENTVPPKQAVPEKTMEKEEAVEPAEYQVRTLAPYQYTRLDSVVAQKEIALSKSKLLMEDDTAVAADGEGSPSRRVTQGYRIQVYATTNYKEAERKKEDLLSTLEEKVYVVYEFPYYKIRVGNFAEENDTRSLKRQLTELGHEAWVVKTKVRLPKQQDAKK